MDFFGSCLYLNIAAVVEGWNGRRTQSLAGVSGQKDVMSSVKVQLLTLCSCKLTLTCVCGCKPGWSQSLMHFHLWQDLLSAGILPLYLLCASAKDSLQFWHWIRMCVWLWVKAWASLPCCLTVSYRNEHVDLLPNHWGLLCFKIWKIAPSCLFSRVQISSPECAWWECYNACRSKATWIPHPVSGNREFAPQHGKFSGYIRLAF